MLRDYQSDGVERLRDEFRKGKRRVLLCAPTGSGKTTVFSHIAQQSAEKNKRVLILAHRRELIEQASARLDSFGLDHGIIMASHWRTRPSLPIQVASVQTLARREIPACDLIVIDEAHRASAASYLSIIEAQASALTLGVTATPVRSDGRGLADLFESMVELPGVAWMTERGYLVRARHFAPAHIDLTGVSKRGADFDDDQLSDALDKPDLVGDIVTQWQKSAAGRQTVVFAVSVLHSQHIAAQFNAAGIPAAHLDGNTPGPDRAQILADLMASKLRVVSNCMVLTEGWDCPPVSAVVLARPTMSMGLYLQMAGRALRPHADKLDCIILDHASCAEMHGLVADERDWDLSGQKKSKSPRGAPNRTCDQCFSVYPAGARRCPECGFIAPVQPPKEIAVQAGELKEVDPQIIVRRQEVGRAQSLHELERIEKMRGYKPGWARHIMQARSRRFAA
jgi:DNA repair protein RadD